MITKRTVTRQLMTELKAAYAAIDAQTYDADPDGCAQAIGRYDGLKRAYVLLTAVQPAHFPCPGRRLASVVGEG